MTENTLRKTDDSGKKTEDNYQISVPLLAASVQSDRKRNFGNVSKGWMEVSEDEGWGILKIVSILWYLVSDLCFLSSDF